MKMVKNDHKYDSIPISFLGWQIWNYYMNKVWIFSKNEEVIRDRLWQWRWPRLCILNLILQRWILGDKMIAF